MTAARWFIAGVACLLASAAVAQEALKLPTLYALAPKPVKLTPFVAPNRPVWRLADLLAKHRGQADWSETLVKTSDHIGQYISMAPGEKTKTVFYADDRVFWIVQSGQIRFTIQGQQPFVASKGFLVEVPFRTPYSLETVGDEPSLRFEARPAGQAPIYPLGETPTPVPGVKYITASYDGAGGYDANNRPYVDFYKDVVAAGKSGRLIWDARLGVGTIVAKAVPTPPASELGHFHESFDEWWFILDGQVDFRIEGVKPFTAHQGDIVFAPVGRWHLPWSSGTGSGTRVAVIARTGQPNNGTANSNLHFFQDKRGD